MMLGGGGGEATESPSRVSGRGQSPNILFFSSNTFDVNIEHVFGLDFNAEAWRIAAVELSKPNSSFG